MALCIGVDLLGDTFHGLFSGLGHRALLLSFLHALACTDTIC